MIDSVPIRFEVISQDKHGAPVCCSHCARYVSYVAVLPLTSRIVEAEENPLWIGLCAYCVLAMAKALAQHGKAQNGNESP